MFDVLLLQKPKIRTTFRGSAHPATLSLRHKTIDDVWKCVLSLRFH